MKSAPGTVGDEVSAQQAPAGDLVAVTRSLFKAPTEFLAEISKQALTSCSAIAQARADYFLKLADCTSPAQLFQIQGDYARASIDAVLTNMRAASAAMQKSESAGKS